MNWQAVRGCVATLSLTLVVMSCGKKKRAMIQESAPVAAEEPAVPVAATAVATIDVGSGEIVLETGQTTQLAAVAKDAKGGVMTGGVIVWTSSDPAVITVDERGTVTAVSKGAAQITALSGDVKSKAISVLVRLPILSEEARFQENRYEEKIHVDLWGEVSAAKDEVIIDFIAEATWEEIQAVQKRIEELGGKVVGSEAGVWLTLQVWVSPTTNEMDFIKEIKRMPGVADVDINMDWTPFVFPDGKPFVEPPPAAVPEGGARASLSHPRFAGDWWIEAIQAEKAWAEAAGFTGAGIGIVDTGLEAGQRVLSEQRIFRYDPFGAFLDDDDTKLAPGGHHGRWVTALAAGFMDEPDNRLRGMAQSGTVYMVDLYGMEERCTSAPDGAKVCGRSPKLRLDKTNVAIQTAMGKGAQIVNVSIGLGFGCQDIASTPDVETSPAWRQAALQNFRGKLRKALDTAKRLDRLLILGSGNSCEKSDEQIYPTGSTFDPDAWQTHALIVGATDASGKDASFSTMGAAVNILAPGENVALASGTGWQGPLEKQLGLTKESGTSFGAPFVAGTAALVKGISPSLAAPEVRYILLNSASPTAGTGTAPRKILNAHRAVVDAKGTVKVPLETLPPVTLVEGQTQVVNVSVTLPSPIVPSMDVLFLIDTTSSYADDIDTLQANAQAIIADLSGRRIEVQFGVASFADFPVMPYGDPTKGDKAFYMNQAITGEVSAVKAAIESLDQPLHLGGDTWPESQLEALYQSATGAGRIIVREGTPPGVADLPPTNVGWRTASLKLLILATDAPFHRPETDKNYFGATWDETVKALKNKGISVVGISSGTASFDLTSMAQTTGGTVYSLSTNSAGIAKAIGDGVTDQLKKVDLTIEPVSGSPWMGSIVPSAHAGVLEGETRSFTVTLVGRKKSGALGQTYDAFLWVRADGSALVKRVRIPILVSPSGRPEKFTPATSELAQRWRKWRARASLQEWARAGGMGVGA